MGTLVFQATLGGQVNLTGPNTASTFTISVPAVTGTMITSGDTATVTSTMISGPVTTAKGGTGLTSFTANGVVYASSSSALATGSALTFDGTNLGIGASSPAAKLHIGGSTASTQQAIFTTGVSDSDFKVVARNGVSGSTAIQGYIGLDYANGTWPLLAGLQFIRNSTSGELAFTAGATSSASEQMRLTSTGLGIGTSSPNYAQTIYAASYPYSQWINASTGTGSGDGLRIGYEGGSYASIDNRENLPTVFTTNATERMRLDASGNLGLGVTPSAWNTITPVLQIQNTAFSAYQGVQALYSSNAVYTTGWKYLQTGNATYYSHNEVAGGVHAWFNAPSGTAGNAITFTQRMTLDSFGNLLVGTTSENGIGITLNSGNYIYVATTSGTSAYFDRRTSAGTLVEFRYSGSPVGSISTNGTLTAYNVSSDQRLKENIVNAPEFGSVIDSLQVRSFDWKSDQSHQRAGFIAQELVSIAPEAVTQPSDAEEMMGVDYSKLVPMLVKEIQSLRQRVAQLESN